MRMGWVSSAASLAATTVLATAAASVQFGVSVTVVAPCAIQLSQNKAAPDAVSRCTDGTKAVITVDKATYPAVTETASAAPAMTRVTISY